MKEATINQTIKASLVKKIYSLGKTFSLYNFSESVFPQKSGDDAVVQRLAKNYGKQLLIPLFQESTLYKHMNTINKTAPRFTAQSAYTEVSDYLGIGKTLQDRIFLLLDRDEKNIFIHLIGYAIGFGVDNDQCVPFFQKTFAPGSIGTNTNDRFVMEITNK